jgi:hypothetical protein
MYSIDLDNVYICGLTLIKDFFVTCQFTLPKKEENGDTNENNTKIQTEKIPELCVYRN